jgi:hypothetical protein
VCDSYITPRSRAGVWVCVAIQLPAGDGRPLIYIRASRVFYLGRLAARQPSDSHRLRRCCCAG